MKQTDSDTALPAALDGIDVALGLRRMSGNVDLYRQVANAYLSDFGESADIVADELARRPGDRSDLVRLIHTVKGLLRSLGALDAGDAAEALEATLRSGDPADVSLLAYAAQTKRVSDSLAAVVDDEQIAAIDQKPSADGNHKFQILMVDDEPSNIAMLAGALAGDYTVMVANSGAEALDVVQKSRPDLILLDVMMPGMDGYEVCRRLNDDPKTRDIPIIFVTAMDEDDDEALGFSLGAVDYIKKPVSPAIARARVRTQLALREAQSDLVARNLELETAIKAREDMERVMRHDLKSPLNAVIGMPDILLNSGDVDERTERALIVIREAGERMLSMINLSLDLARIEQGTYELRPAAIVLKSALDGSMADLRKVLIGRDVSVNVQWEEGAPQIVLGEELLLRTMVSNLMKNAVEASPEGGVVDIIVSGGIMAKISFRNKGSVPEDVLPRFFDKYVTSGKKGGTGLGTYSARLMASVQGGTINLVTSNPGETEVCVSLPLPHEDSN